MFRTLAAAPLLAAALLALAACGPTPEPGASTPAASPTPTSAPETAPPVDPLDTVTRILLLTDTVYFGDEAGWGVDGFRYDAPHAEALAKLTAVFGEEPVSEIRDESLDGSISESHRWGGFHLYFLTGAGVRETMGVEVTTASVNGIAIETEHGVGVGTPMTEAVALADDTAVVLGLSEVFEARFDHSVDDDGNDVYVVVYGNDDGTGDVRMMIAPIESAGY